MADIPYTILDLHALPIDEYSRNFEYIAISDKAAYLLRDEVQIYYYAALPATERSYIWHARAVDVYDAPSATNELRGIAQWMMKLQSAQVSNRLAGNKPVMKYGDHIEPKDLTY